MTRRKRKMIDKVKKLELIRNYWYGTPMTALMG